MSVDPIQNPLPGERVIDVVPTIQPQIEPPVWHRHLNLFTGRSLSSMALTAEQQGRAGRLATRGQMVSAGVVQGLQVDTEREDAIWVGDTLPTGAKPFPAADEPWNWIAMNPTPLAGRLSHQSPLMAGLHQHGFIGATNRLVINPGDLLIAYVYLDPNNPPTEILLQWHDWEANSWEHRAFWGANTINLGTDNTDSRRSMGALPERGKWVRLEVPARQVGLEGKIVDGMIFTLQEGRAVWDQIGKTRSLCRIAAGFGITAQGEDVIVLRDLRLAISDLPVHNQETLLGQLVQAVDEPLPANVGILVLQPVAITVWGKPRSLNDEDDVQDDAFDDLEQIDGCRLLYCPWLPDWFPLPEPGDRWRNRLAYAIFSAEKGNGLDEVMPWEEIGVPLALIAFDDTWNPLFIDSAAVMRSGGKPKPRTPLVSNAGSPFLWQARMQQFAEQLAELDLSQILIAQAANQFRYLPPVGVLPKEAIDARANQDNFFPALYVVQALPIPVEQLDLAVQASASLLPFDLFTPDQVQVLVPVPQQFYDPDLLQREEVDPLFNQTIQEFVNRRADWLQRRELVRQRQTALVRAITGTPPLYPTPDPDRLEIEPEIPIAPPNSVHVSILAAGLHQHFFESANPPLSVTDNEQLAVWVYLDRDHPPREIMLQWKVGDSWEQRAYWGENLIPWGTTGTASRQFMGELPDPGQWMRLEILGNLVGLANTRVDGMAFTVYDGRAAWGTVSKQAPGTAEAVWIGDDLPAGAGMIAAEDGWNWLSGSDRLTPFEADYGTARVIETKAHISIVQRGLHGHSFTGAASPLSVAAGEKLFTYVYLDPDNPPSQIMLQWWVNNSPEHRAYWGENVIQDDGRDANPGGIEGTSSRQSIGHLPLRGQWVRLEVAADRVGLVGVQVQGMEFKVVDGRVAWAASGKTTSTGEDILWVADALPQGASQRPSIEGWRWVDLTPRITASTTDFETRISKASRLTLPLEQLKQDLIATTPLAQDAVNVANPAPLQLNLPPELKSKLEYETNTQLLRVRGVLTIQEQALFKKKVEQQSPELAGAVTQKTGVQENREEFEKIRQGLVTNLNAAIDSLYTASQDNGKIFEQLEQQGLDRFTAYLEAQVTEAENRIKFGYLRIQADVFRVDQYLKGNATLTRTAPGSALAGIVENTKQDQLAREKFTTLLQSKTKIETKQINPTRERQKEFIERQTKSIPPKLKMVYTVTKLNQFQGSGQSINQPDKLQKKIEKPFTPSEEIIRSTIDLLRSNASSNEQPTGDRSDAARTGRQPEVESARSLAVGKTSSQYIGRIEESIAVEAKAFAVASKYEVVRNLADLSLNLQDLPVPAMSKKEQVIQFKDIYRDPTLIPSILKDQYDDIPDGSDEATFFAAGVAALDSTTATLKLVEERVKGYRVAIALCQQTRAQLNSLIQQLEQRFSAINQGLAEVRQDVSIARALLSEETARVQALNDRRDQIIRDFVPFLVFQRPRAIDALMQTPTRILNPGLIESPVPACLHRNIAVPAELHAMIAVVREAPLQWFTRLPRLLDQLDQIQGLHRIVQTTVQRVTVLRNRETVITSDRTAVGQGINRLYMAQQQMVLQQRVQTIERIDLNHLLRQHWQYSRQQAESVVSLGDLIEGHNDRSDLSQQAARELQNIARVVTCLYANIGEVLPVIRLEWAEILSQYDDPVNLQDLADLPLWTEIPYLERRESQSLVDWLYQQINRKQPEAVALISDLIRMCILLASHAPINQIITGRVAQPTIATQGNRVELAIDPALVRIGMQVLLYSESETNRIVAQGVVEDLAVGRANARITQAYEKNAQLKESTRVQFTESRTFNGSELRRS